MQKKILQKQQAQELANHPAIHPILDLFKSIGYKTQFFRSGDSWYHNGKRLHKAKDFIYAFVYVNEYDKVYVHRIVSGKLKGIGISY